ncbi:hypothetical protein VNO77_34515 [Canavalia gladiata]|uniref:Uncharacterized protein n=1 Tax=Canavalia gladiata TaxID=3824 RepID=A0AAN9Q1V4_CANGL
MSDQRVVSFVCWRNNANFTCVNNRVSESSKESFYVECEQFGIQPVGESRQKRDQSFHLESGPVLPRSLWLYGVVPPSIASYFRDILCHTLKSRVKSPNVGVNAL